MKEGLDAEGYIAAECAAEKIPALFRPVLDECLDLLAASFAERIHGVYLYGSVATGKAVAGQSDLDVLIVWAGAVSREDQAEIKRLAHGLTLAHRPLLREVGLEVVALDEVFAPANLHGIGLLHQAFMPVRRGRGCKARLAEVPTRRGKSAAASTATTSKSCKPRLSGWRAPGTRRPLAC